MGYIDHTKNLSTVKPIYLFITGNGGCGKSHLAKTLCHNKNISLSFW